MRADQLSGPPREVIPALIARLRSCGDAGRIKANWIEDVYSEVLEGLEKDNLPDPAWIDDLSELCCTQLTNFGDHDHPGEVFEAREGRWGWFA